MSGGLSRVKNPERIRDVRAFYCRALSHEISHQRGQQTSVPVDDTVLVTATGPGGPSPATAPHRSVEEAWLGLVRSQAATVAGHEGVLRDVVALALTLQETGQPRLAPVPPGGGPGGQASPAGQSGQE